MMRLLVASLLALAALCAPAAAQSCPPWGSVKTLTVGQWQACFDAKQNALGYVPVNKAGDTMIGPLTMAASSTVTAGINIQPGVAPTSGRRRSASLRKSTGPRSGRSVRAVRDRWRQRRRSP
jgi:hypothetical protein